MKWYLAVALAGCGSVSKDDKLDAAVVVDSPKLVDAPPPQGRCSPTGAWGSVTAIAGINTANHEYGARGMPDELTLFLSRSTAGSNNTADIYSSTRASTSDVFSPPTLLPGLVNASGLDNFAPTVTADSLTLYQMAPGGSAGYDILVSTRTTVALDFSQAQGVTALNSSTVTERDPYVLPSGNVIYYSRQGTAGEERIYRAALGGSGFGTPQEVAPVNLAGQGTFAPVVTPDELTMYFSSARPDAAAKGGYDIWMSKRASTSDPFGVPTILPELNSTADDWPTWISSDGCLLYVSSSRAGSYDAYEVRRAL